MAKAISFNVVCPFCHSEEDSITINLNNLRTCECSECGETFTPAAAVAKVREALAAWEAVARWVEMAPAAMRGDETISIAAAV